MSNKATATMKEEESDAHDQQKQLLDQINMYEKRGAISAMDAKTLRHQLHDSTSGQWKAVEVRLKQLMLSWNPYQDSNGTTQEATSPSKTTSQSKRHPKKMKERVDFYTLLQIADRYTVTSDEIKRQFRKLALQLHPDKQRQASEASDSAEFARLRLAYETLNDPELRAAYDAKLLEQSNGVHAIVDGISVKDQVTLEASSDFASLEWMARVKHKMDVMDRIGAWATMLSIPATELRFETGQVCRGHDCGKIVSMDRDLECSGSLRRRVYVCLLHKYIHACDGDCTSHYGDTELDKKVCRMRAYWLVQNWIFDQLNTSIKQEEPMKPEDQEHKEEENVSDVELVAQEIHLGDSLTRFSIADASKCRRTTCAERFQFLEEGVYVCKRHGTPHICTFEQCDRKHLSKGLYVCWISHNVYGCKSEQAGTGTRTRQLVYTSTDGETNRIEMEVPVLLPLGHMTSYLLKSARPEDHETEDSVENNKRLRSLSDDMEEEDQPVRKRMRQSTSSLRQRLNAKLQQTEQGRSFLIYLKVPPAVANLPKVALELQDETHKLIKTEDTEEEQANDLLPLVVRAKDTVNYIKYWMEELTEQQLSIWDQQIYWGDTLIGEEERVMVLEEHGITANCVLELRLHDDCPLQVAHWHDGVFKQPPTTTEYNTVQISKEAEEDLEEQQEEWETVVAAEERAFQEQKMQVKRRKLEQMGALNHMEVIEYKDPNLPKLMGVVHHQKQLTDISKRPVEKKRRETQAPRNPTGRTMQPRTKEELEAMAFRALAAEAQPVKAPQKSVIKREE